MRLVYYFAILIAPIFLLVTGQDLNSAYRSSKNLLTPFI